MTSTNSLNDYSVTPSDNTNIGGTNIQIGCAPQDVGVFMRTLMAQLAYAVQGTGGAVPVTWHVGTLVAGSFQLTGEFVAPNGIVATGYDPGGAQFRAIDPTGTIGVMLRNDGSEFYLLATAPGNAEGTYSSIRPFYFNVNSGAVSVDGTGAGVTFGGGINAAGTITSVSEVAALNPGNEGGAALVVGDNTHAGYVAFYLENGTRVGYVGFGDGSGNLVLEIENGYTGYSVAKLIAGTLIITGNAAFQALATGQTAPTGDDTANFATTAFVQDALIGGTGQSWQTVTGSRSIGATYTNSTSRPISVAATVGGASDIGLGYTVGSVSVSQAWAVGGSSAQIGTVTFIVPEGNTYSVTASAGSLQSWSELR